MSQNDTDARELQVACDTPLGVEIVTLKRAGRGVLIVERLVEKFAEAKGLKPEECELVSVSYTDGAVLWPSPSKVRDV